MHPLPRGTVVKEELSDEELMLRLAAGEEATLAPLHARYAARIFSIALRSLDHAAAEEIVQDVFVAIWRRAKTYDPGRGPVQPWILQIARTRVLNELRRRGRRPATVADPGWLQLATVPDGAPGPEEEAWRAYRQAAVRAAVDALPPPQRQALSLALFEELSHEQIATFLGLPLGTAKTRIRAGRERLRVLLVPLVTVLAVGLIGGLAAIGGRWRAELARSNDALRIVTASDATVVRLAPAPGTDPQTHGQYRTQPGAPLAVLTLSHLALPPEGSTYQIWARYDGAWQSLGAAHPDVSGSAVLIVDQPASTTPAALQVTLEPGGGDTTPSGPVVVAWTAP
jgi:RNA polymerase sigma-70 factor, ECF subfamily